MPQMPTPFAQQIGDGVQQHHHQRKATAEADPPAARRAPRQHDRADLVGDRAERVAGADDGRRVDDRAIGDRASGTGRRILAAWSFAAALAVSVVANRPDSDSAATARYVVRGRVFNSAEQRVVQRLGFPLAPRGCSDRSDRRTRSPRAGQTAWQAVNNLAVADRPVLPCRLRSRASRDPLHAIGAFLHHAAAAHRHVGIAQQLAGSAS